MRSAATTLPRRYSTISSNARPASPISSLEVERDVLLDVALGDSACRPDELAQPARERAREQHRDHERHEHAPDQQRDRRGLEARGACARVGHEARGRLGVGLVPRLQRGLDLLPCRVAGSVGDEVHDGSDVIGPDREHAAGRLDVVGPRVSEGRKRLGVARTRGIALRVRVDRGRDVRRVPVELGLVGLSRDEQDLIPAVLARRVFEIADQARGRNDPLTDNRSRVAHRARPHDRGHADDSGQGQHDDERRCQLHGNGETQESGPWSGLRQRPE